MPGTNSNADSWLISRRGDYIKEQSYGGTAVTSFHARKKAEKNGETQLQVDQQYDASQLSNQGVQKDDYQFNKMHEEEGGFTNAPEGTILKNKYRAPLKEEVAGFDLSTGINQRNSYMDFNGNVANAIKMLATSTVNSATGERPKEDIYPLSKIAYESFAENMDFPQFKKQVNQWDDQDLATAWRSAQRVQDVHDYEEYYKTGSWKKEQEDTGENENTVKYADLPKNTDWVSSSRYVMDAFAPGLAESLGKEKLTDEELSGEAFSFMSQFNWNITAQSIMAARVMSSDDPNLKRAFYDMMSLYDAAEYEGVDEHMGGVLRGVGGIVSDPVTYLGLGVGSVIVKGLAKKKLGSKALKPLLRMAIGAAPEGALYGGLESYNKQSIDVAVGKKDKVSAGEVVADSVIGGATFAASAPAASVVGKGVKKGTSYIAKRLRSEEQGQMTLFTEGVAQ